MKKISITTVLLLLIASFSQAGDEDDPRLILNPLLAPFYHGVASGDPLSDAVIIWTRVTTTSPTVTVDWEMSTDTSFEAGNIIASGQTTTDASMDCTVKIDVTGLSSNTYYYYRFKAEDTYSIIGRTKTAPSSDESDQLRFVTVSCASLQHGYFNVYEQVRKRNDIDAIFHLGDYIYEYAPGEYGETRNHIPDEETIDLIDYRTRYSQYRLDPDLRNLHQQYPFINTWDDHESADNAYKDGAENHSPGSEGLWTDRLSASAQAYSEWIPIRNPDTNNKTKIYRKFSYGDLADVFVLDTRIIGRDEQLGFFDQIDPENVDDTTRELLGKEQLEWVKEGLINSTAKWKILVQQVMVAPFKAVTLILNPDQWDGYAAERERLFGFIRDNEIDNVVVLTGDIHSTWMNDLPFGNEPYDPNTGANSIGVEFVTTSVTSPGIPIGTLTPFLMTENKHMKHINLTDRGFGLLNLTSERAQNDLYFVKTIDERDDRVRYGRSFYTNDGDNHLTQTLQVTQSIYPEPILAPDPFDTMDVISTINNIDVEIIGLFPNPVISDYVSVQFFVEESAPISISLYDLGGQLVANKELGNKVRGLYSEILHFPTLSSGNYTLSIKHGNNIAGQSLIKLE